MNKSQILRKLRNELWTRLKPSTIAGIGVFAIRDIPAGTEVFSACKADDYIEIPATEFADMPDGVREYVKDFFVREKGIYYVPSYGAAAIDQSYFLNHSKTPNLQAQRHGEIFVTTREIKAGEELTADYNTYGDEAL